MIVNDIIDPYYDWPLNYQNFINYMKSLYGSVDGAKSTVYEYRKILSEQTTLIDGTVKYEFFAGGKKCASVYPE